jgi:hypothetical protein
MSENKTIAPYGGYGHYNQEYLTVVGRGRRHLVDASVVVPFDVFDVSGVDDAGNGGDDIVLHFCQADVED